MENVPSDIWIAACALRLHGRWHTVPADELERVAADLWADQRLAALPPAQAADLWLKPVTSGYASTTSARPMPHRRG
ncbi:MAG: hypothetical protein EOP24_39930 [Hyphomicrobiales bacterium]|nr:MAG: hypothetical protein EOP24_39930 [Hyphomicrobiales bacterium]